MYQNVSDRNKEIIKILSARTKALLEAGPEACRRYLIDLGIYNEDDTLSENYGGLSNKV